MRNFAIIVIFFIFVPMAFGGTKKQGRYGGCDSGHWVQAVYDNGRIVQLEDGSLWKVDPVDAIDSALWLPTTGIVACYDKLINTDDNEVVSAIRIR